MCNCHVLVLLAVEVPDLMLWIYRICEEIAAHVGDIFARNNNMGLFLHSTPHFAVITCTKHITHIESFNGKIIFIVD
jgi:hypothetical protein